MIGGFSSVGRASASQAEGHGFKPRNPLHKILVYKNLFKENLNGNSQVFQENRKSCW